MVARIRLGYLLPHILTNGINELLAVAQVNKAARNDIRRGQEAATALLYRQDNHKDALG